MKKIIFSLLCLLCCAWSMTQAATLKAKHVVLIGIDGWGAYSVPKAQNIPNIKGLMERG